MDSPTFDEKTLSAATDFKQPAQIEHRTVEDDEVDSGNKTERMRFIDPAVAAKQHFNAFF